MKFRATTVADVATIVQMLDDAKGYLASQHINQWQMGYPNESSILLDIQAGESYVLEIGDEIVGSTALSFVKEETYEVIEGSWLSDEPYAVLHRVVVADAHKGKGYGSLMLKAAQTHCMNRGIKSIKIDTHEENLSMQCLVLKNNYTYCGVIYLMHGVEAGQKRLAYEWCGISSKSE